MDHQFQQPDARPIASDLIDAILSGVGASDAEVVEVTHRLAHSNDFAEVRLSDGRTLVAKRGRFPWSEARFRASARACALLGERTAVVVPRPLALPEGAATHEGRPVEAYWRIDLPTLQEAWPRLGARERRSALRSWGALLARVHAVRLPAHGPLLHAESGGRSFVDFLASDLRDRLLPAVAGEWPMALPLVERLLHAIPRAARRVRGGPRFLHGDMHMGNVLCRPAGEGVECVGLLDLETAAAGPVEMDLASLATHHGPLFAQPLEGDWLEEVVAGYGLHPDPALLAVCRAHHLLNMGFYSALVGHRAHARQVAREVRRVLPRPAAAAAATAARAVAAPR